MDRTNYKKYKKYKKYYLRLKANQRAGSGINYGNAETGGADMMDGYMAGDFAGMFERPPPRPPSERELKKMKKEYVRGERWLARREEAAARENERNNDHLIRLPIGKHDQSVLIKNKPFNKFDITHTEDCIIINSRSYFFNPNRLPPYQVIRFVGEKKETTQIDNACFILQGGGTNQYGYKLTPLKVIFENLTFKNENDIDSILTAQNDIIVELKNCTIINNPYTNAVKAEGGARVFLSNCIISNNLLEVSGSTSFLDIKNCHVGGTVIPKQRIMDGLDEDEAEAKYAHDILATRQLGDDALCYYASLDDGQAASEAARAKYEAEEQGHRRLRGKESKERASGSCPTIPPEMGKKKKPLAGISRLFLKKKNKY